MVAFLGGFFGAIVVFVQACTSVESVMATGGSVWAILTAVVVLSAAVVGFVRVWRRAGRRGRALYAAAAAGVAAATLLLGGCIALFPKIDTR